MKIAPPGGIVPVPLEGTVSPEATDKIRKLYPQGEPPGAKAMSRTDEENNAPRGNGESQKIIALRQWK